jgi:hypothetical protein
MRRILPEEVKQAYERTGLKPIRNGWHRKDGEQACGCALTAVCLDGGHNGILDTEQRMNYAEVALGLDPQYARGFLHGFDCVKIEEEVHLHRQMGWEDGQACAEAVGLEI